MVACSCSNPIKSLYVTIICCCVLTQWQLYDPDGDSRQKVSNGVLSDGVVRQPWQDRKKAQQEALQPGTRTPGGTHTQTHTVSKAIELQIRPKTKPIPLLTNIVLSPSPKMTGTSFLLAPQEHPAVLYPGQQWDKAAHKEEGHFAQCCPSEINIKDYWLYSLVV